MRNITFFVICLACLVSCQKTKVLSSNEDATLRLYGNVKECIKENYRTHIQFGDTIPDDSCFRKRIIRFDKEGRELYYFSTSTPSSMFRDGRDTTMVFYYYSQSGLITRKKSITIRSDRRICRDERYNYSESGNLVFKTETMFDTIRSIFGELDKPETYDTTYGYYLNYDSTIYKYDNKKNLIKECRYSKEGDTIKLEHMIRYQYDAQNREISGAKYNSDGSLHNSWEITYFPDGSYVINDSSALLNDNSVYYEYNKQKKYNGNGLLVYDYKNSNYSDNNMNMRYNSVQCRYGAFYKELFDYNEDGQISSVEIYKYDLTSQEFEDESWSVSYQYDQKHRLVSRDVTHMLPWYAMHYSNYGLDNYNGPYRYRFEDKYNWTERINLSAVTLSLHNPITITKRTILYWE